MLQYEIRRAFSSILKVIIPQDVSLTILKGTRLFPHRLHVSVTRRCRSLRTRSDDYQRSPFTFDVRRVRAQSFRGRLSSAGEARCQRQHRMVRRHLRQVRSRRSIDRPRRYGGQEIHARSTESTAMHHFLLLLGIRQATLRHRSRRAENRYDRDITSAARGRDELDLN